VLNGARNRSCSPCVNHWHSHGASANLMVVESMRLNFDRPSQ
jgi:hypothetical protein